METNLTEIEAIHASQHGDLQAFNSIILRYQDFLFRVALRITGDEDMASDAVQETCLLVFKKISSYRDGSFRGWLARIITNVCYDEFRWRSHHSAFSLDAFTQDGDEIESPYWLADFSTDPETQVEVSEFEKTIQTCLERISADHRTILILIDMESLSYEEASIALQIPIGTIKSRLARARAQMRATLRSLGDFPAVSCTKISYSC
jgi:RNA polymerase sigma-70 factor (ECF subfamily)